MIGNIIISLIIGLVLTYALGIIRSTVYSFNSVLRIITGKQKLGEEYEKDSNIDFTEHGWKPVNAWITWSHLDTKLDKKEYGGNIGDLTIKCEYEVNGKKYKKTLYLSTEYDDGNFYKYNLGGQITLWYKNNPKHVKATCQLLYRPWNRSLSFYVLWMIFSIVIMICS